MTSMNSIEVVIREVNKYIKAGKELKLVATASIGNEKFVFEVSSDTNEVGGDAYATAAMYWLKAGKKLHMAEFHMLNPGGQFDIAEVSPKGWARLEGYLDEGITCGWMTVPYSGWRNA